MYFTAFGLNGKIPDALNPLRTTLSVICFQTESSLDGKLPILVGGLKSAIACCHVFFNEAKRETSQGWIM